MEVRRLKKAATSVLTWLCIVALTLSLLPGIPLVGSMNVYAAGTALSAPQNLDVTISGHRAILSWSAPATDYGVGDITYRVEWIGDDGVLNVNSQPLYGQERIEQAKGLNDNIIQNV